MTEFKLSVLYDCCLIISPLPGTADVGIRVLERT